MSNRQLSAVIADDEPLLRRHLNQLLSDYWPQLEIKGLAKNGQEALQLIEQHQPDVVFLDIKMPEMDGMSVAKTLTRQGVTTQIVFITAYDEYALKAFEANAIDYLLKPIGEQRLNQCIEKLKGRLAHLEPQEPIDVAALMNQLKQINTATPPSYLTWLRVTKGDDIHLIATSEVLYFKAEDKYVSVFIHQQGQKVEYLLRTSLKELLQQLDPQYFWQIHRSTIVNVAAVEKVNKIITGKMVVVIGNDKLPVSRAMQSQFTNVW